MAGRLCTEILQDSTHHE